MKDFFYHWTSQKKPHITYVENTVCHVFEKEEKGKSWIYQMVPIKNDTQLSRL